MWKKMSQNEICERVFGALDHNINFRNEAILGIPASYLDKKVFFHDAAFLKEAPFMSTMVQNPNHIGCHTIGESEPFFKGTQAIEKEVIEICGVDILQGKSGCQDGYITSGGTEANLQAVWVYRNYFLKKWNAKLQEICILSSEDRHYSIDKAANIFVLDFLKIAVDHETRVIDKIDLFRQLNKAKEEGKKYFIVICNMMTTMFGSIDDVDIYSDALQSLDCKYMMHVDAAFGGFYYPFLDPENKLTFDNSSISSFTLDAHKMAQAPYGTGIFIIRKNLIQYCYTSEASYVKGEDCTLIGSRSGANAVAVWMILMKYGQFGWIEKLHTLHQRTDWLCQNLNEAGIKYFRHKYSNIVTINADFVDKDIANQFGLVPDNHHDPKWYKIVVMEHVDIEKLMPFVETLKTAVLS